MDQKDWNAYLVKKATKIDKAILDATNRGFFDKQLKAFRGLRDKFQRALEREKEKARANPGLRYSDENMPSPKPGMILETHHVLDEPPRGFWREKLPFDPEAYLARYYAPSMSGFYPSEQDTQEGEGALALACEAALWAAIHDFALDAPAHNRLCPDSDTWLYSLWQCVEPLTDMDDWNTAPERRNKLEASFRRVQAQWQVKVQSSEEEPQDVNQRQTRKPGETGQEIAHAEAEKAGVNIHIQAENVQIANRASIRQELGTQNEATKRSTWDTIWRVVKKVVGWTCALVGFLAALLTILYYLGWL